MKCCQAEPSSAFAPGITLATVVADEQVEEPLPLEGKRGLGGGACHLEAGSFHYVAVTRVILDSLQTLFCLFQWHP